MISKNQQVPVGSAWPKGVERYENRFYSGNSWKQKVDDSTNQTFYLTARQVPSSLAVTAIGTRISRRDADTLEEAGFPLQQANREGRWYNLPRTAPTMSGVISRKSVGALQSLLEKHVEENTLAFGDDTESEGEGDDESTISSLSSIGGLQGPKRFNYEDPFETNAVVHQMMQDGKKPHVLSWPAGVKQLQDSIPPHALGKQWEGNRKRGIPFYKIGDIDTKMNVLMRHTHWGKLLSQMCDPKTEMKSKFWARSTRARIRDFLKGKPDPRWSKATVNRLYGEGYKSRDHKSRALRFLQVLQTVDGMFCQIYLADPASGWTWEYFDRFVLRHLSLLLEDEFHDGDIEDVETVTHYETLKRYRGEMKAAYLRSQDLPLPDSAICESFREVVMYHNSQPESEKRMQSASILIQTRGCGTPPPLVVLKSKRKFLLNASVEPPPLTEEEKALIEICVQSTINTVPDAAFTGLTTKAGVHVSGSACFEHGRETGGTTEYIRTIVSEGTAGRAVKTYDLNDGSQVEWKLLSACTEGEYIFWRCMEEVLSTPPDVLTEASLVMIREPGKARTVTKARGALKIVLDVVNGICSYPLKVGMESSSSGMGKSNHGWNFFKEFYGSWKELTFDVESTQSDSVYGGSSYKSTKTYRDLFVGCTDYEEATDNMHHEVASIIGNAWLTKCGVPAMLVGIVNLTCFQPRTIYFHATGGIADVGSTTPTDGVRKITLRRGVLMGDPLTKVILHLLNASVRQIMRLGSEESSPLRQYPVYLAEFARAIGWSRKLQ